MVANRNEKVPEKEPILVFTGRISRCAGGYHVKVRPSDVNALGLEGNVVRIELYHLERVESVTSPEPEGMIKEEDSIEQETRQLMSLSESIKSSKK